MPSPNTIRNGLWQHWVVVRPEPPDQFTAQVVGLPEVRATAASRQEAIQQVRSVLGEWLASGQLVPLELPQEKPLSSWPGHDPQDPLEQEFRADLERFHQEDLERTLREEGLEDQPCSNTSSTPTT